jgi:8-oxo-dGTP diphosphatase
MNQEIINQYGNHLRVRVCGICVQNNKILLINHLGLNDSNEFWSPPGGGLEFGETIAECLKREFLEETNTVISVGNLLKVREFINLPLHAIELYYEVKIEAGKVKKGFDPEMDLQIIKDIQWFSFEEILSKNKNDFAESLQEIIKNYID